MDSNHLAHGLAGDETAPDWPTLTSTEVGALLRHYPQLGKASRIEWHSPRPLSAACLVETDAGVVFIKRHHHSVRSVVTLSEEHRFMAHLRRHGIPVPAVSQTDDGQSAVALGDWTYEIHERATGIDLYRDTLSWTPLPDAAHAITAGAMLATMHEAAEGYEEAQRGTHVLVARSELVCAADPVRTLREQLPDRPGLAGYLTHRAWPSDLGEVMAPWHANAQPQLARQPRLWTHGDWHVSNLCWADHTPNAPITAVLDFGLCASNFALFDLATAIERNAIAWLMLATNHDIAKPDIAVALITGYRRQRPLAPMDVHLLAELLPLVHVDFALSEVAYYDAITRSRANADVAYDTFLRGHAAWFRTTRGQDLLQAIRDCACDDSDLSAPGK